MLWARTRPSGRRLFVAGRGWVPSGRTRVHPDGGCSVAGRGWVCCRARTRLSGRQLVLLGTCPCAVVRCVLCALSGFAAPGVCRCLAPVSVPWLWPAACVTGVPSGPAWCAAPRLVRSLPVPRSAFPTPWCLSPPRGLAPPALLGGCAGHAEAGREPGSLCLPLALAEEGALGLLRVVPVRGPVKGLSLAGPSGARLGLRALRWLACVDPLTDASGFSYRPSFNRGLGRCTGAVSCGRRHLPLWVRGRHARVPCVCACARPSWACRCLRCPGPLGSCPPVCPLGALFCLCSVLGHLAPVHPRARLVRCFACAVSWAAWLLLSGVPARCVVMRVRCPGPLGACSPVCTLGALLCVCGDLGHLAPVHRCAAGFFVWCVLCPGPLGSCSPVCPLGVLFCLCGVLGHLAPVHRWARSVCCVACAVSWANWLLFTGVPARCVACVCGLLRHLAPVHRSARSACCVAFAVS